MLLDVCRARKYIQKIYKLTDTSNPIQSGFSLFPPFQFPSPSSTGTPRLLATSIYFYSVVHSYHTHKQALQLPLFLKEGLTHTHTHTRPHAHRRLWPPAALKSLAFAVILAGHSGGALGHSRQSGRAKRWPGVQEAAQDPALRPRERFTTAPGRGLRAHRGVTTCHCRPLRGRVSL